MAKRPFSRRRLLAAAPLLAAPLLTCALGGCTYEGFAQEAVEREDALTTPTALRYPTYQSVDRMYRELQELHPDVLKEGTPAIVGSIVDIRNVNHSTPFGNIIADLVRTHLVQLGVSVIDMRLRSAVKLSPTQGQMVLSRNPRQVYPPPPVGMICSGTYAVGRSTVYVSLKMIRATNAEILAAADFYLPRSFDVRQLLIGPVAESDSDTGR